MKYIVIKETLETATYEIEAVSPDDALRGIDNNTLKKVSTRVLKYEIKEA